MLITSTDYLFPGGKPDVSFQAYLNLSRLLLPNTFASRKLLPRNPIQGTLARVQ